MSLIERAAGKAGIELDRDVPVPGQRRARDWAKIIGTARKLESEEFAIIEKERRRLTDTLAQLSALQAENFALREKVRLFELAQRMTRLEISKEAQQVLIGDSKVA